MATIIIPTPLRKFTNQQVRIVVDEQTVGKVISKLTDNYPSLKIHLLNADGNMVPFINLFVDNEDVRNLKLDTITINENSIISIVPAIAGGIYLPDYLTVNLNNVTIIKN